MLLFSCFWLFDLINILLFFIIIIIIFWKQSFIKELYDNISQVKSKLYVIRFTVIT